MACIAQHSSNFPYREPIAEQFSYFLEVLKANCLTEFSRVWAYNPFLRQNLGWTCRRGSTAPLVVRSRVSRRHLVPKRSLAVMPRPEGLQVRLMGCNRRPRADLFSQRAQAAQVAGRVRVGFGLGPVQNRLQQRPIHDRGR